MRVLVTGGAGYIGSHTVQELLKKRFEVLVFDNFSSGKKELLVGGKLIQGDLRDKTFLKEVFRKHHIDAVIHFASLIQAGESFVDPQKYYRHNLLTCLNLFQCMLENRVRHLVFSSSAAVYGWPQQIPVPETHPINPFNPYGQTKSFIEKILMDYDQAYKLNFISLRYFNAAGADPDGKLGELHNPETHLIPNILLYLLGVKDRFDLYGTDFPTPDGTAIRDYIHVTDLARAHLLALQRILSRPRSDFINLGANKGYSVLEIIKSIEQITGEKIHYHKKPQRKGDVPILLASNAKAKNLLQWNPRYSDIHTILQTAWNWHKKRSPNPLSS